MLTPLDETLRHQLPTTFDHAGTSDPRFFDRYWFAVYDPDGAEPVLNAGICSYLNMNVVDGYTTMISDGQQRNLRLSRRLRPDLQTDEPFVTALGPMRVTIIEPFQRLQLELAPNASGMQFDLMWTATMQPYEELHNFNRLRGRVTADFARYNQSGWVDGWIDLDGRKVEVCRWWGGRDHSWGVRTDVAGGEPMTEEPSDGRVAGGFLWSWLTFGSDELDGHVQLHQRADGSKSHAEAVLRRADGTETRATDIELDFSLTPGTRRFSRATWRLSTPEGDWQLSAVPSSRPFVMLGMGYSMGYADERGFGVWRGPSHLEHDTYELPDVETVVMPDGRMLNPYHRDTAVRLELRSPAGHTTRGAGHCALLPIGPLPSRGLQ
jgi:hypothetical protein